MKTGEPTSRLRYLRSLQRFFFSLVTRALRLLPPESAHSMGAIGLKLCFGKPSIPIPAVRIAQLPRLRFPNRLGVAAGFDKNADLILPLQRVGFGFLEVGTFTPLPQAGNPKPRLWRLSEREALVNQMGFNNCGAERAVQAMENAKGRVIPLFANIGKGKNTPLENAVDDYVSVAKRVEPWVDGFVINLSSPNTPGLRDLQTQNFLENLARTIGPVAATKPIWIKLAPDLENTSLTELCLAVKDSARFSGVVVTNTSTVLAKSIGRKEKGGLSGRPLFTRALECVGLARRALGSQHTVIGVGGIASQSDARAFREAGADLIEIYTSFVYRGPLWARSLAQSLDT